MAVVPIESAQRRPKVDWRPARDDEFIFAAYPFDFAAHRATGGSDRESLDRRFGIRGCVLCRAEQPAVALPRRAGKDVLGRPEFLFRLVLLQEIDVEAPIHLRTTLSALYWHDSHKTANASAFYEDTLRYLYLPRLKSHEVLAQAIRSGIGSRDFFGYAYGESGSKFEGFQFGGGNAVFDDSLILIEPGAAKAYEEANRPAPSASVTAPPYSGFVTAGEPTTQSSAEPTSAPPGTKAKTCHVTVEVPVVTAKMRLVQLSEEIVSVLCSDPNASVRLIVEISAEFPDGASETVKRAVTENANSLGLKAPDWE